MKQLTYIRAYIRPTGTLTERAQRDAVEKAAAKLGLPFKIYVENKSGDVRAAWIRALRRDEVAMVSRLELLAGPRKQVGKPSADFMGAVTLASSNAAMLYDADRKVGSNEGQKWAEVATYATNLVTQGRRLTPVKAREMANKSHENREPGIVARWRDDPAMRDQFNLYGSVWRDRVKYPNAVDAVKAMPAEIGSVSMAYRIWESRVPKRKRKK
jgi:hypothetical protein